MNNNPEDLIPQSVTSDERTWAKLAHISAIIAMIISAGWLSFIGPLVIWVLQKDKSSFARKAAADSFNFNVSMWLMSVIGWVLILTIILIPIGIIMIIASFILTLIHHIKAFMTVDRGQLHHYPFCLPILS